MAAGDTLTIGGAFNSHSGIVSIPSSFFGDTSTSGSLNQLLENYLGSLSNSIQGGTYSFENNDIAGGSDFKKTERHSSGEHQDNDGGRDHKKTERHGSDEHHDNDGGRDFKKIERHASGFFEEFTNTDQNGKVTGSSVSGAYRVSPGVTDLVVQAPGDVTLTGNGTTKFALFGADSNVTYNQTGGGSSSIFAAGGSDSIYVSASNVNDTVYSAGKDTITFNGVGGKELVNAEGNATTTVFIGGSDSATVTASDNAKVGVHFIQNSGGTLDFINNSTQAQTVFSAAHGVNSVTVNAGAGGGLYVGGLAGNNSLIGGSGAVTLVGGGSNDVLEGKGASNDLIGGTGIETLIGANGSGNNVFQIGVDFVGAGHVTTSGIASTNGSGLQSFIIGNTLGETLTGSTVAGSTNLYDIAGSHTTSGSTLTITNFGAGNSVILLVDSTLNAASHNSVYSIQAAGGVGGGTDVYLNDGTTILLKGVKVSDVFSTTLPGGITAIGHT